jgi:predicted NodU family carbamoyl transferase
LITSGINYSEMHDSVACIARDGHILFAVAEERLSRLKHDARFPSLSIEACLAALAFAPINSILSASVGRPRSKL